MTWFWIALIGPALYAATNHIDKYLLSKYLHDAAIGALIIFSALFGLVATPIILAFHPELLSITLGQASVLIFSGALVIGSILCYFYALNEDEATFVVPFYQTIPIFAFILGYAILGETLTRIQLLAAIIVLLGAAILSFDLTGETIRFKHRVVVLMLIASCSYAVSDILFKLVALDQGYWNSTFWTLIGKALVGAVFFIAIRPYRQSFLRLLKNAGGRIISLNSLNETLTLGADLAIQYAVLLAPVALVLLVNAFQPFFVFLIGALLTLVLPHVSQENLHRHIVIQKIVGILIIIGGSIWLG